MHCLTKFSREAGLTPIWDMRITCVLAISRVRLLLGVHRQIVIWSQYGPSRSI